MQSYKPALHQPLFGKRSSEEKAIATCPFCDKVFFRLREPSTTVQDEEWQGLQLLPVPEDFEQLARRDVPSVGGSLLAWTHISGTVLPASFLHFTVPWETTLPPKMMQYLLAHAACTYLETS